MNMKSHSLRSLSLLCILACAASVSAQPDLDAFPVESLLKDPRWIPIENTGALRQKDASFGMRVGLPDGTRYDLGDPVLGEWAEKISRRGTLLKSEYSTWAHLSRHYRIEGADRVLLNHARNQHIVHLSLALVATPQSADALKALLNKPDPDPVPDNVSYQYWYNKPYLTAALIRLGDEEAMKLLLSEYRKRLLNPRDPQGRHIFPQILKDAYSPQLIQGMMALVAEAPELKLSRDEIQKELNKMKVRGLPLEDLRLLVEGRHPKIKGWRGESIFIIAEYGTIDDFKRFVKLRKQMKDDLVMAISRDRAATYKAPWMENQRVLEHLDYALILMRCRLWKELKK